MEKSTIFSALDLKDGYYQVFINEIDVAKMAVGTPSGMLWEWLVMPQGKKGTSDIQPDGRSCDTSTPCLLGSLL